jgi:signal peptidase I
MLSRLINTITWLLVAGSVAIILGGLLGRPVLMAAVPTTSMVPVLRPGDLVPVMPLWGVEPTRGQIVIYKTEQDTNWIVHRIVGGDSARGFIAKGDANPVVDPNRVFMKDIAGMVPTIGSAAVHIPKLGSLSLDQGPFSNPLLAGVALVVGVYLLIADAGTALRRLRMPRWRRLAKAKVNPSLSIYLGLALVVFLAIVLTSFALSTETQVAYQVVTSRSTLVKDPRIAVAGRRTDEPLNLKNPSVFPVVVSLSASDPDLEWEPSWVVLGPYGQKTLKLVRLNQTLGEHKAALHRVVYLLLLPPGLIQLLAAIDWRLPVVATATVPVILVLAAAASDTAVRVQWQKFRLFLRMRFGM